MNWMRSAAAVTLIPAALLLTAGSAHADNQSYLADLYTMGMPVSEYNQSTLIQLGQETCSTARANPSMEIVDLAMTIAMARVAYEYEKAHLIVVSALENLSPDADN